MKKFLILIVFSIFMFKTSYAADACSYATKGGVYDGILDSFVTTAKTWNTTLLPLVTRIFWGVFAAEFLYQLTFKKILSNDLSKLYVFFVIRMFTAYIFAYVFLNLDTYMGIINFFTRIGAELGGQTMSASEGSSGMGISPSGIMSYLECEFATLNALFLGGALLGQWIGLGTFFSEALLGVVVGMNLIAVIVTVTMLDAYVVIFGGFILVGFSGSSWTQSYWQKYLSYAVATGIRLFMTCLILGLVFKGFDNLNTAASTPTEAITSIFKLLGYLILSVYLLFTVPSKAASMLTGSMGGGMGELVGAASMLMAGGSMAKLAGGSAKSQASALMEKLGGPGKNPSPSTLKSNTTTATQSAKSETAKSGKVEAMGKSMGQGEQPTPKPKFNDSLPDSGSTPAPTSSGGSPSSSSSGSTPAPSSSAGSPSSSSSGSTPAPTSSGGSPSSSSSGSTPAPSSSAGSPSSSSSVSTPAPSGSGGSPSSSSSGSTPAPSSSGGNSGSISNGKGSTTPQPSTKATLAKHGKSFADSVNKVSSGHAGAADININPHKE
ncbi:MAG: type IV secretion system protein [Burkholderiales bacterium]|nr:type IV secretion system protein [Burkholderiales bacterium]